MQIQASIKPYIFVIIQLACLIAIGLTGPLIGRSPVLIALKGVGVGVIVWSAWAMRRTRLSALPDVPQGATLVTGGPYAFVRHPIYSGLLLITLALVLDAPTPPRVGLWVALLVVLMLKLTYEEARLTETFSDYEAYCQRTKRLVPFLF